MKNLIYGVSSVLVILMLLFSIGTDDLSACTTCHSKNPKMVRMHEALGFKDCFTCHGPTAKKSDLPMPQQMTDDERCVQCHGKKDKETPR